MLGLIASAGMAQDVPRGTHIRAPGNPILADGYYSTDPAPVVIGDTLWILAGRDEAAADVDDFVMKEWQLLSTRDPASGDWVHYPAIARPETVFGWAEPARAYAGQIVQARNGRLYLYAPVVEKGSDAEDPFAIGVAAADSPTGPWRDAHPSGPIVSQRVPVRNDVQNIDPTVLIDDDGRVYLYWGTFGELRGIELARDMVTPIGPERRITGLTGFFEAPWIMKRRGVYYMLYAGNTAGPGSACTPAIYHACIAYGTAPSPMGPWTYRGVVLKPVSSTTSHPGAVDFKGRWYLAYHTADAVGGGHFRRSVAIDPMLFDDSVTPAAILPVVATRRARPASLPSRNIAGAATAEASNEPVPVRYWLAALNDGIVRAIPLPPDMWGSRAGPARQWIAYRWDAPVTLNGARMRFWADQAVGSRTGIAPPKRWWLEYWDGSWKPIRGARGYGTGVDGFESASFKPVTTRCLRAVFETSGDARGHAGVAVQEWVALAPHKQAVVTRNPAAPPAPPCV